MEEKKCIKCGRVLPLSEFYIHNGMSDCHLGKCKDCFREESKARYDIKKRDEAWMEKERARGREKYHRLNYKGRFRSTRSICSDSTIARKLRHRGYDTTMKEAHHWNYNHPRSVFLISRSAHKNIHRHTSVNYEDKYCYTEDGVRIETEEQAKKVYSEILLSCGIHEDLQLINF